MSLTLVVAVSSSSDFGMRRSKLAKPVDAGCASLETWFITISLLIYHMSARVNGRLAAYSSNNFLDRPSIGLTQP